MKNALWMTFIILAGAQVIYAQEKKVIVPSITSKTAVTFPDTKEGQIAIQTGNAQYEVLAYMEDSGHIFAQSCETNMKKSCKAHDLKTYFGRSQRELADKCSESEGESRIARRHGVKRITSVCYFKDDKSFVEIY